MDLYQLGKDIQLIHEKLDSLAAKESGPLPDSKTGDFKDADVHELLAELTEQFHFLAAVVSGKNFVTGEATQQTWDDFLAEYNPEFTFDWCCRCKNTSFGSRYCKNIKALTRADAHAQCMVYCGRDPCKGVTEDKCGRGDRCSTID